MAIYLYKKTHQETGLKYLGKTIQDPYKYKGSGKRWINHIKKHGYKVDTEIIKECSSAEELKFWGEHYSKLWNVVESSEWANLKPESGDGGSTPEMWKKISNTMKGRPAHNKGVKYPFIPRKKWDAARKEREKGNWVGSNGKLKGLKRPRLDCPHCNKNIDVANFNRYHGDNCKHRH
jgi:hypothetical protein